jgi:hypothetical protein
MMLCMIVLLYFCLYMFSSTSMADLRHGIEGYRRCRVIITFDSLFSTENAVAVFIKPVIANVYHCELVNSIVTVNHTLKYHVSLNL